MPARPPQTFEGGGGVLIAQKIIFWRDFIMKNMEMKKTGNKLTITVDLSKDFGQSKSGKSTIIASSEGNVEVPDTDGSVKIGLNIYKK